MHHLLKHINAALAPLYSRVFSYRDRIYKYFLPVLITKCIFFLLQDSIPVGVSLFLLRILYIDWVLVVLLEDQL